MGGLCGAAVAPLGGGAGGSRFVHLWVGLCLQLDGSALPLGDLCCLTGHQAGKPKNGSGRPSEKIYFSTRTFVFRRGSLPLTSPAQ